MCSVRRHARFANVLLLAALAAGTGARAAQPAEARVGAPVSIGTPMRGALRQGQALPRRGLGYVTLAETQRRRARFGSPALVALVAEAAAKVARRAPGSLLRVGDLSSRQGGPLAHHGSHQNGRDADLLFYLVDAAGRPAAPDAFVAVDVNGFSTDPPLAFRFDTARNWALVEALLISERAEVQWIFVSGAVKALLLAHAERSGAPRAVVERARQVLRRPGNKGHPDHFHVRIYCPPADAPACEDVGPLRAWVR